jgi:acylphosphatase
MTSLKTVKIVVTGHVQGVFFRAYAKDLANELGISGWIRNEPGGNVSVTAQGPSVFIDRFIKWCHEGPPTSKIKDVTVKEDTEAELYEGFEIRY